jgi:hypothetical protein
MEVLLLMVHQKLLTLMFYQAVAEVVLSVMVQVEQVVVVALEALL